MRVKLEVFDGENLGGGGGVGEMIVKLGVSIYLE